MNPELFTNEYKNFKYLSSSPAAIDFYKTKDKHINSIPALGAVNSSEFIWPGRIEFIEQLIHLTNDTIFIINARQLLEIRKPVVYKGSVLRPKSGVIATIDDKNDIWNNPANYCMCPISYFKDSLDFVFRVDTLPILPGSIFDNYNAMFYDRVWATKYHLALLHHCEIV